MFYNVTFCNFAPYKNQNKIMKTETIPIRVDKTTRKKLEQLAQKEKRTLSDFVRIQLEKVIEVNEQLFVDSFTQKKPKRKKANQKNT